MSAMRPGWTAFAATAALSIPLCGASAQLLPPANDSAPAASPVVEPDALAGQGRIVFIDETADAGEIFDLEPAPLEFKFRNVGGGPLTVTSIKPTCGCTVAEMEQKVYAPNEIGTIKVTFDPHGRQGNVARTIQVFTDSITTPAKVVTVKAFVKPVVLTIPSDIVNFEAVNKGQSATREVRVMGRFPEFEVSRVSITDPMMYETEVVPIGSAEVMGETLYEHLIRVTLKDDAAPGNHASTLTIRTNDERKPLFSIAVMSRVIGDLELSPVRMTLGRLAVGDTFERELRVRSRSAQPFELTGAAMSNPAVAVDFTVEPVDPENKSEWIVRAKGRVLAVAPRFNTTVNLLTDVKGEELTPVQMNGVLRPN